MQRLRFEILASCAAICVLLCLGCSSGDREIGATGENPPQAGQTPPSGAPGSGPAPTTAQPAKVSLKDLQATYDKAKKEFDTAKSDPKAKLAYIDAANALGNANLGADELPPRVKYPAALGYYREVLKVDPKNENAKTNSDLIISIYKQMGRPVPGGG